MDYKYSRGWRNNNPLNIEHSDAAWQGMMPVQKDKRFVDFVDMSYGYRAAIKIMLSYYHHFRLKGKTFCIDNIICRWAPDGNEINYVATVEKLSKIDRYERLPRPDTQEAVDKFCRIMAAMTKVECGCPMSEVPMDKIKGGYWLAFHLK